MMTKQEVIEKIEACKSPFTSEDDTIFNYGLDKALSIIKQLDEPEKPVVPQFVADWYEEHKEDLEYNLYRLCIDFCGRKLHEDLHEWFNFDKNKPIETLILMHKFGYEVEKEKLYTVEIPNPNSIGGKLVLFKQQSTGRLILDMLNPNINKPKYIHLTEPEIKKDFEWAWQFAKDVEK
nr:MAG TPA: Protein of unknown function (DUF1642) [Caudoviricetes sp.]